MAAPQDEKAQLASSYACSTSRQLENSSGLFLTEAKNAYIVQAPTLIL